MPDRSPSRLPKYRHYKPKDLAVVRLDGRDVYLGRHGSTESREKYRRAVAEWLAGSGPPPAAHGRQDDGDGPSVAEVVLAFWRHAEVHYRQADGAPTGELDNLRLALRPLRQLYGGTPARNFGPKSLKAVRQALVDSGLCRLTVNQRVGRLVRVFRWAVEAELVPASVHHGLKAVAPLKRGRSGAREGKAVGPVPDERVDAILPHAGRQVRALVELQRLTGMRSGEACIMRTGDIDQSGRVWMYTPASHKTTHRGHRRTVYLGPRAQEILRPWLRADPAAYLFQPREAEEERQARRREARATPLTPSQRARKREARPGKAPGDRYDARSYAHAVARACDRAFPHPTLSKLRKKDLKTGQGAELKAWRKAQRWHPHQLRHSAATQLRKEFGLEVARIILGHTSPAVTELYAEADQEKAVEVMERVG